MTDMWACGSCRSVNNGKSNRCYSCHAPRAVVAVAAGEMPTLGKTVAAPAEHPYRSARLRALLASGLILAAAVISLILWWYEFRLVGALLAEDDVQIIELLAETSTQLFLVAWVPIAVAGLIMWAAWISRMMDNLPALGLGYPQVTPTMAFVENFLPGFNIFRMPARIREVTRKLQPNGDQGLIAVAWLALFGSWLIARVATLVIVFTIKPIEGRLQASVVIDGIVAVVGLVGYLLVILIIVRTERMAEARAREQASIARARDLASERVVAPTSPSPGRPDPTSVPVSWSLTPSTERMAAISGRAPRTDAPVSSPPAEPASRFAADRTVQFLADRAAASAPRTSSEVDDWDEPGPSQPHLKGEASPDEPGPDGPDPHR